MGHGFVPQTLTKTYWNCYNIYIYIYIYIYIIQVCDHETDRFNNLDSGLWPAYTNKFVPTPTLPVQQDCTRPSREDAPALRATGLQTARKGHKPRNNKQKHTSCSSPTARFPCPPGPASTMRCCRCTQPPAWARSWPRRQQRRP